MTCIVGVEHEGKVYLGGDAMASDGYSRTIVEQPKVFVLDERFVIGFTHTFRLGQLLRYKLRVPLQERDQSDEVFLHTVFVDAVRELLKSAGHAEIDKSIESGGTFLLGYHGRLYRMQPDYSLLRNTSSMDACGAGEQYALGALYVAWNAAAFKDEPVEVRLRVALQAAEKYCVYVGAPFHFEAL